LCGSHGDLSPSRWQVDFTSCTGLFCVLGIVVVRTSILRICSGMTDALPCLWSPQFLAYDTQLLVGNKQYGLSPEEYIFDALEIYVDIVYIFLFLLRFLGWK
uniref:Uncharacterized protein n=1 Tax=Gopherus agassizii TaxID=38772 RepID=A0A452I7A4_9SAUR